MLSKQWARLTEWACFKAWNYARRREMERRKWIAQPLPDMPPNWSPDQRRILGNEASQVLENRHFREAWDALSQHIDAGIRACDADDKDRAQRLVISKQLLYGLRREFIRKMEDGYMASVEISEVERRRRVPRFER